MVHPKTINPDERLAALEAIVELRTRALQEALDQRTALIHELDHRVKNNLQLISSLMLMQARRSGDPAVRAVLASMVQRLNAVSTVHRRLFSRDDLDRFDVGAFVRDLVCDLAEGGAWPDVGFVCVVAPVEAPVRLAGPLALVVNELISSTVRHAFPVGRGGEIRVSADHGPAGLRIEVARDGTTPITADPADEVEGFGMTIVDLLVRQLQGSLRRDAGADGARIELIVPLEAEGTAR